MVFVELACDEQNIVVTTLRPSICVRAPVCLFVCLFVFFFFFFGGGGGNKTLRICPFKVRLQDEINLYESKGIIKLVKVFI